MVDPVSGAAGGAVAKVTEAGADAVKSSVSAVIGALFLPVATDIGIEIRDKRRAKRAERQLQVAKDALTMSAEAVEAGGKPQERVVDAVGEAAATAEDRLLQRYLSGVLASSVTDRPRDDRALASLERMKPLSHYALTYHFSIYTAFRIKFRGSEVNFGTDHDKSRLFIGIYQLIGALPMEQGEVFNDLFEHSVAALESHGLLETERWGNLNFLKQFYPGVPTAGVVCRPTRAGAELYGRVHGKTRWVSSDLFSPDVEWPNIGISAGVLTAWTLEELNAAATEGAELRSLVVVNPDEEQ